MTANGSGGGRGAGHRVALVIGNGRYQHAPPLPNPANDARDISATLKGPNFEVVEGYDLTVDQMDTTIADFAGRIANAETALFFYAGHGLQVDGENYLVPINAQLDNVGQLRRQTITLRDQLMLISDKAQVSVFLLDCCRDNPFTRSLRRSSSETYRSVAPSRGMASVDVTGRGSMIAFATAPDQVASDGGGPNSPFTQALLKHLPTPGQSLNDVMIDVTDTVATATDGRQILWSQSSLRRRVFLSSVVAAPPAEPAKATGPDASPGREPPKRSSDDPSTSLAPDTDRTIESNYRLRARPISRWALYVVLVVAAGLFVPNLSDGSSPPPPAIAVDPIILRIGDINATDEATRRSMVADLEKALATSTPPSQRLSLVTALVRMAADHSMQGLAADGRFNLIYLLAKVEAPLWRETGWETVWADARKAWADLTVRGEWTAIGEQTQGELARLRETLFPERRDPARRQIDIAYADRYPISFISQAQAWMARRALTNLDWKVREIRTWQDFLGLNEVRYGGQNDRAVATQVAFDLRAAGFPVDNEPVSDGSIGAGRLEVRLSTAAPDDSWKASMPVAAWCFQRVGPKKDGVRYSVRCHKDAAICMRARNGDQGERSSTCRFIAYLDRTQKDFKTGGTDDSYRIYGQMPFGDPFPQP